MDRSNINQVNPSSINDIEYDIGIWLAGYEARSSWLIKSDYKPEKVRQWYKILLEKPETSIDYSDNENINLGLVLGGERQNKDFDGQWSDLWINLISCEYKKKGEKLNIFIDYSSMPRTIYGTLIINSLRSMRSFINLITFAYVPGKYSMGIESSRKLLRLRPLIGTEGTTEDYTKSSAYIFGLGFNSLLTEAIIDFYQISKYSCFYANPGVDRNAAKKCLTCNENTINNSERIIPAPVDSINQTLMVIDELCEWYTKKRSIVLLPLGPKPHVLASILYASFNEKIAFRWVRSLDTAIQVKVSKTAIPILNNLEFT